MLLENMPTLGPVIKLCHICKFKVVGGIYVKFEALGGISVESQ